jgi:alkylhydroperoxidase family enzyme
LGKLSYDEVARNLSGSSEDPKRSAAIAFSKTIAELRGKVSESDLADVRAAGYTDSQILEIVGLSVQFLLTNFINNVARTDSEFPDEAD